MRRDLTKTQGYARFDWPRALTEAVALEADGEVGHGHDVASGYEGHVDGGIGKRQDERKGLGGVEGVLY